MKGWKKKFLAVVLSVAMTAAPATYSFADDTAASENGPAEADIMDISQSTADTMDAAGQAAPVTEESISSSKQAEGGQKDKAEGGTDQLDAGEKTSETTEPSVKNDTVNAEEQEKSSSETSDAKTSASEASECAPGEQKTEIQTEDNKQLDTADKSEPVKTLWCSCTLKTFKMQTTAMAAAEKDKTTLIINTASTRYSRMIIGGKNDGQKTAEIKGVANSSGGYTFVFSTDTFKLGQPITFVPYDSESEQWVTLGDHFFLFSETPLPQSDEEEAMTEEAEDKTADDAETSAMEVMDEQKAVADGKYTVEVESSAKMFKVVDCVLTSNAGALTAVITLSGTGYDKLYPGTAEEAAKADEAAMIKYDVDKEGRYTYTVPVSALDTGIAFASHSIAKDMWYDRTLSFKSEALVKIKELADGAYTVPEVKSSAKMFVVKKCVLTSKDGNMEAVITLSGTGYDKLYMGTAEDAAKAEISSMIAFKADDEGKYTYTVPVSALDTGIAIAAHSSREDKWFDRTVTFVSEGITKLGGDGSGTGGSDNTSGNDNTGGNNSGSDSGNAGSDTSSADSESKYYSDTSGSTSGVISQTTLPDGVYTPDAFSFSGGTGKVSITCRKVTVSGGNAYAAIVFSSSSYGYLKANGNVYYADHSAGGSTFVIPVQLNQNNKIIGMTTAMSASHEIAYSVFIYIAAAASGSGSGLISGSSNTLDAQAPTIAGLTYQSETEIEHAEYFKIYNYDQGITLLEIDMTKDTARDPEKTGNEDATTENTDTESSAISTADDAEASSAALQAANSAEANAKLYEGNVVKYLIVPENVEIPAGLEKEVIVIQEPSEKTYVSSDSGLSMIDQLGVTAKVTSVGFEKKDCSSESIRQAMEAGIVKFAGRYYEPAFKELVSGECSLSILPGSILPKDDDSVESSVSKSKEPLTIEEKEEKLKDLSQYYSTLKIPMLVDRSSDEKTELAKQEWIKAYGVLYDCSEKAEELFDAAVSASEK